MADEKVTFTGDSNQLQKEYDALAKRAEKLEEKLNKATKAATDGNKKLTQEMREVNKTAEQTAKAVATPLEKYEQQLKKLDAALKAGKLSQENYNRAVAMAKKELDAVAPAQENIFASSLKSLATMAAGWLSVSTAINLATRAHQEKLELDRKAADVNRSVAGAQEDLFLSMAGESLASKQSFVKSLSGVQQRTGVSDLSAIYRGATSGLNMSAGDQGATLAALEAAGQLTRNNPEQLGAYTAGGINIGKASGLTDMKKNFAYLLSIGAVSPVKNASLLSQNAAPAVASVVNTVSGGDRLGATRDAGALYAALSNAAGDVTGASSGTASIAFGVQLRDFFAAQKSDPGTLSGRIGALQGDAAMRQKFLKDSTFERAFQIPVEQLLSGGATADAFRSAQGQISFDPGLYDTTAADLRTGTSSLAASATSGESAALNQGRQLAQTPKQRRADTRKNLADTLDTNLEGYKGYFQRRYYMGDYDARVGADQENPERAALGVLETIKRETTTDWNNGGQLSESALSQDQKEIVVALNEQIRLLRLSIEVQQQGTNNNRDAQAERGIHK